MISFPCAHCGSTLRSRPDQAGSIKRCPQCGKQVEAPSASSAALSELSGRSNKSSRSSRRKKSSKGEEEIDFLSPPQAPDEIGRLGNYRIQKILGSGGMGVVFLAEDMKLKRPVALKVMKKAIAHDPIQRERFIQEAQAAAKLDHDNIVPIYQVEDGDTVPYLAMKLLVGETLDKRLQRQKTLPPDQITRIGEEIAEGLAAAHERGLIHRDIKPANIWLEEGRDRVKLLDFGLALVYQDEDARLNEEGMLVGTPQYMSPEQASGDIPLDHRTDLFSLGIVLYRMATGDMPFKGKTTLNLLTALATTRPRSPHRVNPAIPRRLSKLIMLLLSKNPDERPRNARLVVAALAEIRQTPDPDVVEAVEEEEEEIVEAEPEPEPDPDPPPLPRRRGPRGRRPRARETAEERLARRAINFAIFGGVVVILLLGYLIVRNMFFKKPDESPPAPQTKIILPTDKKS